MARCVEFLAAHSRRYVNNLSPRLLPSNNDSYHSRQDRQLPRRRFAQRPFGRRTPRLARASRRMLRVSSTSPGEQTHARNTRKYPHERKSRFDLRTTDACWLLQPRTETTWPRSQISCRSNEIACDTNGRCHGFVACAYRNWPNADFREELQLSGKWGRVDGPS